jgi:acyl-CoA thioester hydrolase
MYQSETIIEVPFHDVDLMRVVWHGHYAKYFEIARCTLFDTIDYNVPQMEASGYAWPVIDMRVRYAHPITFQQKIRVIASLVEWENRLKVEYLIEDFATGKRLTKGYTVQVAVSLPSLEMQYVSPDILFQKLGLPA